MEKYIQHLILQHMDNQQQILAHHNNNQIQFLFITEGKLKQNIKDLMNVEVWIMDEDNLTDIIGQLKQGQISNATIYSLQPKTISNVKLTITQSNQIQMGGKQVTQKSSSILLYHGGYHGYTRYGFGTIYYTERGKDYEQWGFWKGQKQKGKFIKQNYSQKSQYSIIQYEEQAKWSQTQFIRIENKIRIVTHSSQEHSAYQENITQSEYQKQIKSIQAFKQQLLQQHNQLNFIVPLKLHPIVYSSKFDSQQLSNIQKLTHDQCQYYLQYLFHQKQNQKLKKTAILGLYTIDIQYKIAQQKLNNVYKYHQQINRLMAKYQNSFCLFGGFWDRIIIPLVLSQVNDHYSFAVINLKKMRCTYYDSLHPANTNNYDMLISSFLSNQAKRHGKGTEKLVQTLEFQCSNDIPRQYDSISCGYYMLWGISQLLKKDKVTFTNKELFTLKQQIITKITKIIK